MATDGPSEFPTIGRPSRAEQKPLIHEVNGTPAGGNLPGVHANVRGLNFDEHALVNPMNGTLCVPNLWGRQNSILKPFTADETADGVGGIGAVKANILTGVTDTITKTTNRGKADLSKGGKGSHEADAAGYESEPADDANCFPLDDARIEAMNNFYEENIAAIEDNKLTKLKTGDTLISTAAGDILSMPNGDTLFVRPDGSYDLDSTTGEVRTITFPDGGTSSKLRYPNGDVIHFGYLPREGQEGRAHVSAIERGGQFLGFDRLDEE